MYSLNIGTITFQGQQLFNSGLPSPLGSIIKEQNLLQKEQLFHLKVDPIWKGYTLQRNKTQAT